MDRPKNTRSIKSVFIAPKRQLRLAIAMNSIGILATALILGYLAQEMGTVISSVREVLPETAVLVQNTLSAALNVAFISQIVLWFASMILAVFISHKFYGPLVPILRHIRNLSEGNLTSRVKLRGGDDLEQLADALNELAEQMEKKANPPST